jgi:hypothetical protein
MKKIIATLCLIIGIQANAQLVQGELKINETSKAEIALKGNKAVNLYADFRENKHKINFVFTTSDVPLNSDKKQVVKFVFTTTIKKEGKVLGSMKRAPIPFFPGDMFMPIETFDVISMLSNLQTNTPETVSEIPKGNYEIILEAKPIGVKGQITSTILFLKVN